MKTTFRLAWILPLLAIVPARGDVPAELATAVHHLQAQDSYSWEVINGDPGLVAQDIHTRIGTVKTLQQNTSPHIVGQLASNGDMLFQRDWADGVQLTTFVAAGGAMITRTPDGWLTSQEILTALANERVDSEQLTERASWLKRADRPSTRRPDQELGQLLLSGAVFEASDDGYIGKLTVRAADSAKADDTDAQPGLDVTITIHISRGAIRTYEVQLEGTRSATRAHIQVPVSDDRLVVLTYLPVTKLDVPDEVRKKVAAGR